MSELNKIKARSFTTFKRVNKFAKKKGLTKAQGERLAIHLYSEGREEVRGSALDNAYGVMTAHFGGWTFESNKLSYFAIPLKMKELIWLAAPGWATELRISKWDTFWWSGGGFVQRFGCAKSELPITAYTTVIVISTRPEVKAKITEPEKSRGVLISLFDKDGFGLFSTHIADQVLKLFDVKPK